MRRRTGDGARALERMRQGKNVSVADLADLIDCTPNHLWKLARLKKIKIAPVDGIISIPAPEAFALSGAEPIAA